MVRIQEVKKAAIILLMAGFLAGIIYVNLFAKKYVVSMGIFSDYFLEQYTGDKIHINDYIWYIIRIRVIPILMMLIISNTRFCRLTGCIFLLWTGFSGGLILTTAVLKMSIKGMILCLVGMLPHFICYVAAYMLLIIHLMRFPESRWDSTKVVSLILFMMLGIISECYINPVLMDIYIKML